MPVFATSRRRIKRLQRQFISDLRMGEFLGHFTLEWIGPKHFNYYPDPDDPFRYVRPLADGSEETIQPGPMITDGGSIPAFAQVLTGRTPWEYGPAYMLHDWEFYQHDVNPSFTKSFEEVNLTMAEAIWTLMNKGYLNYDKPEVSENNVYTVYSGVMSPIARGIWDEKPESFDPSI